jgi:hypothetical protein
MNAGPTAKMKVTNADASYSEFTTKQDSERVIIQSNEEHIIRQKVDLENFLTQDIGTFYDSLLKVEYTSKWYLYSSPSSRYRSHY